MHFVRHLEVILYMLIYAEILLLTSQPGKRLLLFTSVLLQFSKCSICIVLFMDAQVTAKEIPRERYTSSGSRLKQPTNKRKNDGIDFWKRKYIVPTNSTCVCSLHFSSDAYILSHSRTFLQSINVSGKRKLILKSDAVPTENKSLDTIKEEERASESKRRQTGSLSRKKSEHDYEIPLDIYAIS